MAELTLHRVSYRYPRAARDALQGVECRFRAGEVAGGRRAVRHRPGRPRF